jgi:C-terminal processing protease CtpA/Prc
VLSQIGTERCARVPLTSKTMSNKFSGKLVVLVDSDSASCSELFAKVIQLEKRGNVLADNTSGAVMESRQYSERMGAPRHTCTIPLPLRSRTSS